MTLFYIDNVCDIVGIIQASRRSQGETSGYPEINSTVVAENGMLRSGAEIHLTPTKKIRRMKVNITKYRQQRVCRDCKKYKMKHICFACYDNNIGHWL